MNHLDFLSVHSPVCLTACIYPFVCLFLSVHPPICMPDCLYQSICVCQSIHPSACLTGCIYLPVFVNPSICMADCQYLSICLSILPPYACLTACVNPPGHPSICSSWLPVYISICLSICPPVCLTIHPSVRGYQSVHQSVSDCIYPSVYFTVLPYLHYLLWRSSFLHVVWVYSFVYLILQWKAQGRNTNSEIIS